MRRFMRVFLPAVFGLLLMASTGLVAAAKPTTTAPVPGERTEPYCAVFVSKERDADGLSKVLAKECSTVSMEDARSKAKHASLAALPTHRAATVAADDVLLANEYRDAGYGTLLYSFWGYEPCDYSGYTLRNLWQVTLSVSSVKGYNSCNRGAGYDDNDGESEAWCLPVSYVGDKVNDEMDRLWVRNSTLCGPV